MVTADVAVAMAAAAAVRRGARRAQLVVQQTRRRRVQQRVRQVWRAATPAAVVMHAVHRQVVHLAVGHAVGHAMPAAAGHAAAEVVVLRREGVAGRRTCLAGRHAHPERGQHAGVDQLQLQPWRCMHQQRRVVGQRRLRECRRLQRLEPAKRAAVRAAHEPAASARANAGQALQHAREAVEPIGAAAARRGARGRVTLTQQ
mmetsp:Transcript_13001/g.37786  ORF Transcript_13001/g.37786 Transcript_13001/m.37786 type:complete len:201 (-) Transcript_13001:1163-1765(-)|eukprot:364536-Chlamydomonas_euryale.AAC.5